MPAPTIRCEFCENHEMRRDAYAVHVKAKHMKEIATLLLEDFKEYDVNTIKTFASEGRVASMAIPSKMYQDAEYWFGVKPFFYIRDSVEVPYDPSRPDTKLKGYPEDLELSQYLKREENLVAHRAFIEEVLQSISLMDFIQIGKNLAIRNPDVISMKRELTNLRMNHKELEESSQKEFERLKREVEVWKETAEDKECIPDLRRDRQSALSRVNQLEKQVALLKEEIEFMKKEHHEHWAGVNQSHNAEMMYLTDALEKKTAGEKNYKEKFETGVKKEAQKLFDKDREEKQKKKEKKKKALKKAKKLAELSDSDSDSDDSD